MSALEIVVASTAMMALAGAGYLAGAHRVRASLHSELRGWIEPVRVELRAIADTLREGGSGSAALAGELARQLAPQVERERLARALSASSASTRNGLPALLESIASEGGFAAVLLADERGLVVAASRGASNADALAGASALLLTYGDRLAQAGLPAPLATLIHDDADQLALHRTLRVHEQRYVLTAIGRRDGLSHRALDPAVDVLERVLARDAWRSG